MEKSYYRNKIRFFDVPKCDLTYSRQILCKMSSHVHNVCHQFLGCQLFHGQTVALILILTVHIIISLFVYTSSGVCVSWSVYLFGCVCTMQRYHF